MHFNIYMHVEIIKLTSKIDKNAHRMCRTIEKINSLRREMSWL